MTTVATLYVRNLPADLYEELKRWADEAGRSVNAEVIELLEREAERRGARSDWYDRFVQMRRELKLTREDADLAIAAIRAHRDAGL
jgi:plasmid stability protein